LNRAKLFVVADVGHFGAPGQQEITEILAPFPSNRFAIQNEFDAFIRHPKPSEGLDLSVFTIALRHSTLKLECARQIPGKIVAMFSSGSIANETSMTDRTTQWGLHRRDNCAPHKVWRQSWPNWSVCDPERSRMISLLPPVRFRPELAAFRGHYLAVRDQELTDSLID
jgi:hypothetical protein